MKFYYDLHIHTALSPCAEDEMTPNNIVNMSMLKELDIIAITDHNSVKNARACAEAAEGKNLIVIPGMEVETSEEIHCVVLFDDFDKAEAFGEYIGQNLPAIKNREDIFGNQLIIDKDDEIKGSVKNLLSVASVIGISELFKKASEYGAAAFPSHVDRASNSVISNLGMMPPDLGCEYLELIADDPFKYLRDNKRLFSRDYKYLKNSDAHNLGNISERAAYFEFENKPAIVDIIKKIRNG